jgi:hypothetical protein
MYGCVICRNVADLSNEEGNVDYDPADPMGDGLGGYGPQFQRSAAHQLTLGNHWVAEQWLRLSLKQGRELEREVDLIQAEQRRMIEISRAVAILQRRRPYDVESFTSDPPFPGRFTYIPVIKDVTELVTADMLAHADFSFDVQDHNLYVVTPYLQGEWTDPPLGMAYVYGASPGTPAPDPHRSPVRQGWKRLEANHSMVNWLVRLAHMEI